MNASISRKPIAQPQLDLAECVQSVLISGARASEPVTGLTHDFYKYPARFSPLFARAAIAAFTQPGDTVLDNHVGGGTTLVEAMVAGRNSVGVDISSLAEFVSSVKTTVFSESELEMLSKWAKAVPKAIHVNKPSARLTDYDELGYYKHLDHPSRWRLRKAIEQSLTSAIQLPHSRLISFGRCAILRTAQWALDGRSKSTDICEFRAKLAENISHMIAGAQQFATAVTSNAVLPKTFIINKPASELRENKRMAICPAPKLVLTSPPYPGVHVLYHRWQVDGRKEAPLPFMIAGKLDGAGSSFYTMGDRKYPNLDTYYDNILSTMSAAAALADEETTIVQMIAFSDVSWQLPRYIRTMEEAGLTEVFLPLLRNIDDGRLWRSVPNRRWYSDQRGKTPGSHEVVLIHRKRAANLARRSLQAIDRLSV